MAASAVAKDFFYTAPEIPHISREAVRLYELLSKASYDPAQARNEKGEWAKEGGSGGESSEDNEIRKRISANFERYAVKIESIDFSEENYNRLFSSGVDSPIGKIKIGENQYQKLSVKGREDYLGAMYQTLHDPVVIFETEKNGKKAMLYAKSFSTKHDRKFNTVLSVVVNIEKKLISISTHRRDTNNVLNKIKKGNILYEKDTALTVGKDAFNSLSPRGRQPTPQVSDNSTEKSSLEKSMSEFDRYYAIIRKMFDPNQKRDELWQWAKEGGALFDTMLEKLEKGELGAGYVFSLGKPSSLLQRCGFPAEHDIELAASRLLMKARQHEFRPTHLIGLDTAIKKPVAVFSYGDKEKSQNVIVELEKDGKNFLAGVFFNQERDGAVVSSIRGLFSKDTAEWLHWIEQGKMLYCNKEKIQNAVNQWRINYANVEYLDLDYIQSILDKTGAVNDVFTEDFPFYKNEVQTKSSIKKSMNEKQPVQLFIAKTQANKKLVFNAIKQNILRHLDELEEKENAEVKKCFFEMILTKGGKGYPVGTVRTWKGKKFVKTAPNKWQPKYDGETRGSKLAISALKKKIAACDDAHDMMMIMLSNRERFSDKDGYPLPFVQDLSRFIDEAQDELEQKKLLELKNKQKNRLTVLNKKELHDFIEKHKHSKENVRVSLGNISEEAKKRIEEKTGLSVNRVILDSDSIRHTYNKPNHNLEANDLDNMFEIINSTHNIELSSKKHGNTPAIIFREEVENGVYFVEEFRAGNKELELITAYRQKKQRAGASMPKTTPSPTSETLHTSSSTIPQSGEKSSGIEKIRMQYQRGRFGFKNKNDVDKKHDTAYTEDGGSHGKRSGTGEIHEGLRDDRVRGGSVQGDVPALPENSDGRAHTGLHGRAQANNSAMRAGGSRSAGTGGKSSLRGYIEKAEGRRFHRSFSEAHELMANSAFVDVHDEDYYKNNQNLLHEDGKTGISVEPNGTITSAFNASKERKGTLKTTMLWAIEHGGDRLDCFDGELRKMYASYGFIPVARVPFNSDYAPEGWDYGPKNDNKPDVLVWRHNGEDTETILEKRENDSYIAYTNEDIEKLPVFSDYGEALAHRDHLIEIHKIKKQALQKSLTYSGHPLQGRAKIHGMDISIENKKGSVRSGVDRDGHEWAIKMAYDYGHIRGT